MSIFENPNTTAVDDVYRYFKKGIIGEKQQEIDDKTNVKTAQVVLPSDDTSEKLVNNENIQKTNTLWYPQEIAFQNNRDSPRNVLKISISKWNGGKLQSIILNSGEDTAKWIDEKFGPAKTGSTNQQSADDAKKAAIDIGEEFKLLTGKAKNYFGEIKDAVLAPDNYSKVADVLGGNQFVQAVEETLRPNGIEPGPPIYQIYLYAPDNIETHYGMKYKQEDLTPTHKVIDLINVFAGERSQQTIDTLKQIGISGLSSIIKELPFQQSLLGGEIDLETFVRSKTGLVPVENLEYLFQRVSRRQFNYSFKFYPKSSDEIIKVAQIIAALKFYAHPEKIENHRYLIAPAIFKIQNYSVDDTGNLKENLFLNRIQPCALTDIMVDYTDVGRFVTLVDQASSQAFSLKSPVGIKISLRFDELSILTQANMAHPDNIKNLKDADKSKEYN